MKRALWGIVWLAVFLLAGPVRSQEAPRLDVVFLLDATGSMGDEIDAVKEKIQEMIAQIAVGDPAPDVRFGIVAYRDRGDEYVTAVYDLTRDIDRIIGNLGQIQASGGGDYPESLNEASVFPKWVLTSAPLIVFAPEVHLASATQIEGDSKVRKRPIVTYRHARIVAKREDTALKRILEAQVAIKLTDDHSTPTTRAGWNEHLAELFLFCFALVFDSDCEAG